MEKMNLHPQGWNLKKYVGSFPVIRVHTNKQVFPGGASGKEYACQCRRLRDWGSIPRLGRSTGGGHGNPLQYFCLDNPISSSHQVVKVLELQLKHQSFQ